MVRKEKIKLTYVPREKKIKRLVACNLKEQIIVCEFDIGVMKQSKNCCRKLVKLIIGIKKQSLSYRKIFGRKIPGHSGKRYILPQKSYKMSKSKYLKTVG